MLDPFDDYPIHQTPEPVAVPASSDPNVYDRTWANGYAVDGSAYFGMGVAVYPHRRILDCAVSVVTAGGRQHCFYGSRRAPERRDDQSCGPFRYEVLEPMRRSRLVLDDLDGSGIACDLTFTAHTAPIEEVRQVLWSGARRTMDATRFAQFGRWSGTITHPDGELTVDETWWGTKDRSWGIRSVGERVQFGAPAMPGGICFVWAPLVWDDHVSHAIFFDDAEGRALVREGLTAPLAADAADAPAVDDGGVVHAATAAHRIVYEPGTRWAAGAELELLGHDGSVRTIRMDPVLRFQMKGLGYLHPEWGQGMWKGELATGAESFDPAELDPLGLENLHVQQVVQVTDGERRGVGVLEQIVVGPYAPGGFSDLLDGASG